MACHKLSLKPVLLLVVVQRLTTALLATNCYYVCLDRYGINCERTDCLSRDCSPSGGGEDGDRKEDLKITAASDGSDVPGNIEQSCAGRHMYIEQLSMAFPGQLDMCVLLRQSDLNPISGKRSEADAQESSSPARTGMKTGTVVVIAVAAFLLGGLAVYLVILKFGTGCGQCKRAEKAGDAMLISDITSSQTQPAVGREEEREEIVTSRHQTPDRDSNQYETLAQSEETSYTVPRHPPPRPVATQRAPANGSSSAAPGNDVNVQDHSYFILQPQSAVSPSNVPSRVAADKGVREKDHSYFVLTPQPPPKPKPKVPQKALKPSLVRTQSGSEDTLHEYQEIDSNR